MQTVGEFSKHRKYTDFPTGGLTLLSAVGFFASLCYTLLGLLEYPGTTFTGEPIKNGCGIGYWLVKNGLVLTACLGNFVTWRCLKRIPEILNPWVFCHSATMSGNNYPCSGRLIIQGSEHGYGKHIEVKYRRHPSAQMRELSNEADREREATYVQSTGCVIEDQLEPPAIGEDGTVVIRCKDGGGLEISPFFVEIARKAIF
jgi:hypothetical protein